MTPPPKLASQDAVLEGCRRRYQEMYSHSGLASQALGLRNIDLELNRLGRSVLADLEPPPTAPHAPGAGPDVYLATQLPDLGGHSRLLGDFVGALPNRSASLAPWLLVTDIHQCPEGPLPSGGAGALGFQQDHVQILQGASPAAKLHALFRILLELRPERIFLFHHPDDPVPIAAIQPGLATGVFLVHHSDSIPCFGLHVPEVHAIELHPTGAAMSRLLGVSNDMLLLTAPDPGPRPNGFLLEDRLVTATAGRMEKFNREYFYGYPDTVGVILSATRGRHVHFGPLDGKTLGAISRAMAQGHVAPDRFVHVPFVPSISTALWEHQCDVYISSFPVDGARTNAEVAASGTPIISHSRRNAAILPDDTLALRGMLKWKTWEELSDLLDQCRNRKFLSAMSAQIRASYDHLHHPDIFKKTLRAILAGAGGVADPHAQARETWRTQSLVRTLAADAVRNTFLQCETERGIRELLMKTELHAELLAALQDSVESLQDGLQSHVRETTQKVAALEDAPHTRGLADSIRALQARVGRMEEERTALRKARGWRARLRRWLMKCSY